MPLLLKYYSRPTLIFCSTRGGTTKLANVIIKDAGDYFIQNNNHKKQLFEASLKVQNVQLQASIRSGVGFHSAALTPGDRSIVEQLFLDLLLPVLCTTSTLSVGVNLPAYLVIVKGMQNLHYDCNVCNNATTVNTRDVVN